MPELPDGIVTLFATDVEGSTMRWDRQTPAMNAAISAHDRIVRKVIETNHGVVFKTTGDGFLAVFVSPSDALLAAVAAQKALQAHEWNPEVGTLKIRIGLHTGEPICRDGDYFGPPVNRVARLMSAGHGGQILVSGATQALLRLALPAHLALHDCGLHRLKDLQEPERIYQVIAPELPSAFPPLKSLTELPNNLPHQLSAFLGRETEIRKVRELLKKNRLVTLLGISGCGKTRLSLQIGAELLEDYPQGVWFVSLGELDTPALVAPAVASVLEIGEEPGTPLLDTLVNRLKNRACLLLLDNCEHLPDACAELAQRLSTSCPGVHILATSRKALSVRDAARYNVPLLPLPDLVDTYTPIALSRLAASEAAQMFLERARIVDSEFALTTENAPAVALLMRRLEGIPFCIMAAASALRFITVEEIAEKDIFRLPPTPDIGGLPHHRTLETTIDFSYQLLKEDDRNLLRQFCVFTGGCTAQAVHRICRPEAQEWIVHANLSDLLDSSLLLKKTHGKTTRYFLPGMMRSYLLDKLPLADDTALLEQRHREYFLAFAEQIEPKLRGAEQAIALELLTAEQDNLRAALKSAGSGDISLRLAGALWRFWMLRGHFTEGRGWLTDALCNTSAAEAIRAKALNGLGVLEMRQSDYAAAREHLEQAIALSRTVGTTRLEAECLNNLGHLARIRDARDEAQLFYEESRQKAKEAGDLWVQAAAINSLGMLANSAGEVEAARKYYQECLTMYTNLQDTINTGVLLSNLGCIAHEQREFRSACTLFERSLEKYEQSGKLADAAKTMHNLADTLIELNDFRRAYHYYTLCLGYLQSHGEMYSISLTLVSVGRLARLCGDLERAVVLQSAAENLRQQKQISLPPAQQDEYEQEINVLQRELSVNRYNNAWERGKLLTTEQAIVQALGIDTGLFDR